MLPDASKIRAHGALVCRGASASQTNGAQVVFHSQLGVVVGVVAGGCVLLSVLFWIFESGIMQVGGCIDEVLAGGVDDR